MITNKQKKGLWISLCVFLSAVILGLFALQAGVWYTERYWEHWYPTYEKADIRPILEKETLTGEEYDIIYRQTGLTKLAVDDMWTEEGKEKILRVQEAFFKPYTVTSKRFNPFTYMESIDGRMEIGAVRDGDIIMTATTRVSWWRFGHAALVVDSEEGLVLEAIGTGDPSKYNSIADFTALADFLIFRPKIDEKIKREVVQFAKENLVGIPYRFTIGIFFEKYNPNKVIEYSQCAHLVWYAYKRVGLDLDSNGGWLIKPQDMALSPHVELVQAFGFDLDRLWT